MWLVFLSGKPEQHVGFCPQPVDPCVLTTVQARLGEAGLSSESGVLCVGVAACPSTENTRLVSQDLEAGAPRAGGPG